MDRRAAGALLALAACIACSAAAPTASNHTALDLYEGASEGCYYNFQHYGEGDRIMTNEPCLNCTCHNRMLMCYLRVCPFTKPIGQDCTVEKRADQCCPIVTCPDVPVDLLTSTSTTSPAEYGATGLGRLDKYGCSISGKYFPEGSKVPPTPNKPCEHCYCIRNMTTCVMQECTLHVDGCTPIYHKDVCCPVRYSCDHPEDELPLLDDMSTTVRPTPGFLLTTTTVSPVTQMTQDCVHNDQIIADGASITTEKACEHCYCMKGDIVCVVQECGAPMENEGKNCTSLPPREGQCCPDTYICEGDEPSTEVSTESATESILEKLTTLLPPRRGGVEGSGYRHEPNEAYTEIPTAEPELEGSGEEQEPTKSTSEHEAIITEKPQEISPIFEGDDQYIPVTTKAPIFEEAESTTKEIERNVIEDGDLVKETFEPEIHHPTTHISVEKDVDEMASVATESEELSQEHVTTTSTLVSEKYDQYTTESGESLNTVPDTYAEKEHDEPQEFIPSTTSTSIIDENEPAKEQEVEEPKITTSADDQDIPFTPISEHTSKPESSTTSPENVHEIEIGTTEKSHEVTEEIVDKESDISGTTSVPKVDEIQTISPETPESVSAGDVSEEKDVTKPEQNIPSTTSTPSEDIDKLTTEPNHAQNTVDVAEDEGYPHVPGSIESEKTTVSELGDIVTEKVVKEDNLHEHITVEIPVSESKTTVEPDKGLNTIPSETDEESSSQPSLVDKTTASLEVQSTELPTIDAVEPQESDIKTPTVSEPSSTLADIHVTKVDPYTITTEPSFRKEDEISASTEKPKEEPAATTIKAEFVDEGLIPTSSHDDKIGTGSDISSMDEDVTTMSPEYIKEIDETVETKQPTTQSIPETSIDTGSSPEMAVEATREPEAALVPSTEKDAEVTVIPDVESHQEPSRIPGEGDCLLNSVTYKNNTVVPSTNICHTGCKCISSIIKCDPIICSPPPDYMDNCQSIYDTPDSCCPTYVCDHPRETIPPQSDNQMSGTEPPVPPPTIECRGDQCELSEPTKPTGSSQLCATGSCLPAADDKTTTQCGPEGCDGLVKEQQTGQPSVEHPECTDGKCEIPAEDCVGGKCELPVVSPPVKPCAGDDCAVTGEEMPASQLCENGNDCEKTEIPIIHTIPSHDGHQAPCKEEEGCQPQEVIPSGCTGEEPCRRVETPVIEQSPSKCQGSDCVLETEVAVTEYIQQTNTESSMPQGTSSEPGKEHMVVEEERPEQGIVTEREYTPTEHYTTVVTEKASEVQDIATEEPATDEKVVTKSPDAIEVYTNEPTIEISTEVSSSKAPDTSQDEQGTKIPDDVEKEHLTPDDTDKENANKLSSVDAEAEVTEEYVDKTTQIPDVIKKHTDEPTDEPGTRVPDVTEDNMEKSTKTPDIEIPVLDRDLDKKDPDAVEVSTNEPVVIKEDESETPIVEGIEHTEQPSSVQEQEPKTTISIDGVHTDKPITIEDEGTKIPDVTEEYNDKVTEKPDAVKEDTDESTSVVESETKVPDPLEQHTTETSFNKEEDSRIPDVLSEEHTDKPLSVEKETKIPDDVEETTDNIAPVEGEGTKIPELTENYSDEPTEVPVVIHEHSDEPIAIDESGTKIPDIVIYQTEEPVTVYEEGTKVPDHGEETSEKQPSINEPETEMPDTADKEPIDDVSSTEVEGINIPEVTEKYESTEMSEEDTKTTITSEEQNMKIPDEVIDKTDDQKLGVSVSDDTTEPSTDQEETTENNELIKESGTKKPIIIDDDIEGSTDEQPVGSEEPSTKPVVVEIDHTFTFVDEEHTSKPEKPEPTLSYQDEEHSGTKSPELLVTQSEILPEEHTKPYAEPVTLPQTSVSDGDLTTKPDIGIVDAGITEVTSVPVIITSESSDMKEPQSQDIDKNIPTESAPEILTEQEKTTKEPLDEKISQDTLIHVTDDGETKSPFEPATTPQESSTSKHEPTKMPEFMATTESVEKITISKNEETFTEQGEIYTDIPARETSAAESPGEEISKPQEGTQTKLPDSTMTESSKVPEEEFIQPASESHITDTGLGYESTSALPEPEIVKVTETPEIFDDETKKATMPEMQDSESEKTPTLIPFGTSEQDIKTDESDIFTPEKEQMITSIKDTVVTEPTMSSFTEIKDASITGDENPTTEYYRETTEKIEPAITIDASSVASPSTSETPSLLDVKTTSGPEELYTNAHEITNIPTVTETKPADNGVSDKSETSPTLAEHESTTSQSPDLSEVTSESNISEEPHRRTEITESNEIALETTELPIPELPVSIVTEPEKKPIDDVSVSEKKTTETVDLINLDASTLPPEISVTNAPTATEIPEAHITASPKPEESKATESSYTQPDITESQETGTKSKESDISIEKTTISPEIPVKSEDSESDIETPLPGVQQPSTDYPATVVEIRTELPQIQVTTDKPQSLVTEYHQPDIEVTTKEQDYIESSLHETEPKPEEEITEKTDLTASVAEVTTSKQLEEVTKPTDQTLAQAEFSETTPYPIVELEEHTHRIQEDISTISPVDEKEHTYESEDVTSTQLPPSKEEHIIAQDITPGEEHLSTVSPSIEEYTQKITEEVSDVSSHSDEQMTAQPETEIQGTKSPSEVKPEEDIETTAKPIDIPSGLNEESSTILPVVSDQTTLTVPEEASESVSESYTSIKPAHEESTGVPPVVQDDDQKDITTFKPTHDLGETSAAIPIESSTLGSDIEAPTEKDITATEKPSQPHIHEASDKTPLPEDEIIYSTTKPTTAVQEDLLTPSSEDKYTKPEDKPTSEVLPPSSTAEVPKPPAEIEPEEIQPPEDDGHFPPSATGYGEPDYAEEDQAFGPGTCRYGGKVYVSAQQIPRDDPCDFCFCFRSDIICLQQSCPPPIHGCHEEPIQGFCCPRYECPVSMATTVNVTTTTTTTTTTLPPHFPTHSYKGAAQRRGCQIKGHTYKVGEVVRSSSGPCLHCKCGGDGQMKCDPKACTPEPMLRQMIAAAVSAKRRR